jgi:hypothetical protein
MVRAFIRHVGSHDDVKGRKAGFMRETCDELGLRCRHILKHRLHTVLSVRVRKRTWEDASMHAEPPEPQRAKGVDMAIGNSHQINSADLVKASCHGSTDIDPSMQPAPAFSHRNPEEELGRAIGYDAALLHINSMVCAVGQAFT